MPINCFFFLFLWFFFFYWFQRLLRLTYTPANMVNQRKKKAFTVEDNTHLICISFLGNTISRAVMRCGNNTWTPWRSTLKRSTELSRMLQRTWPVHDWKREQSLLQLNRITWPAGWECIHAILTEYCDSHKYMYILMSDLNHRLIAWKGHLSTIILYVK